METKELTHDQQKNLKAMAIVDALSQVGFTWSLTTKLALQGKLTAEERRKRQDEAFQEAFESLAKIFIEEQPNAK
jgi:hypothetical protein